ncbi:MAG: dehydrogenase of uncharacterized specificity, short-chain alcohol dehydrogenase like protein [Actinomycetota bacterium]
MTKPRSDEYMLTGRTALVTGATGLIGRAICQEFARAGSRIVVSDIDDSTCSTFARELHDEFGVDTTPFVMDVADATSVESAAARITAEFGVCDAIVVNAGILALKPVLEMDSTTWDTVMRVNLTGAFITARAFAAEMVRADRRGTIVFSSSLFGVRGGAGNAAYSASKFGLIGLSQSMAADLAPHGIRVNAVCPGQIESTMMAALFETRASDNGTSPTHERSAFIERIPLGELGSVEDVARAYRYFSSDASAYVTGQHLIVDGGWQVG